MSNPTSGTSSIQTNGFRDQSFRRSIRRKKKEPPWFNGYKL